MGAARRAGGWALGAGDPLARRRRPAPLPDAPSAPAPPTSPSHLARQIESFYGFVQEWKRQQAAGAELEREIRQQAARWQMHQGAMGAAQGAGSVQLASH